MKPSFIALFAFLISSVPLFSQAPYCAPLTTSGCTFGDAINYFSTAQGLTNIVNDSSGCSPGSYSFLSGQSVTVAPGGSFDFWVDTDGAFDQGYAIWVDWNGDADFLDSTEAVWFAAAPSINPQTGTITIPPAQPVGTYRMRVRCNWDANPTDPCASQSLGETEDYLINVFICNPTTDTLSVTECTTYTVPSGAQTYTTPGLQLVRDTIPNSCGEDSTLVISLMITGLDNAEFAYAASNYCVNGTDPSPVITGVPGGTFSASPAGLSLDPATGTPDLSASVPGTYTITYTTTGNCSGSSQQLFRLHSISMSTDTIVACDSYTWIDGVTYGTSNDSATMTLTNAAGCDSVVTLHLTVNYSKAVTDTRIACDSLVWIDGKIYTASNSLATFQMTNAAGCDSVINLNLTILNSSQTTDTVEACESFTWIDGQTYTSNNDSAFVTLTNTAGCDSVVRLNLVINSSQTATDTVEACGSYTWIDGNTYLEDNDIATYTLATAAGCDSIVTLDLTLITVDTALTREGIVLTAHAEGASYQWWDCSNTQILPGETGRSFTAYENGTYAVDITQNGCTQTSSCYSITTVGLDADKLKNRLSAYPNPTSGEITLDLGQHYRDIQVSVSNLAGQTVFRQIYSEATQLRLEIPGPAGLYLVNMVTATGQTASLKVWKD